MGSNEPPPSLHWYADPRWGAVIGMTFLFFCLAGPVALVIPVIAWVVIKQRSGTGRGQAPPGARP